MQSKIKYIELSNNAGNFPGGFVGWFCFLVNKDVRGGF